MVFSRSAALVEEDNLAFSFPAPRQLAQMPSFDSLLHFSQLCKNLEEDELRMCCRIYQKDR
jgi:hypothetical protein